MRQKSSMESIQEEAFFTPSSSLYHYPELGFKTKLNPLSLTCLPSFSEPSSLHSPLHNGSPIDIFGEDVNFTIPIDLLSQGSIKHFVVTTPDGKLKAYSFDGVNPNLPVPFKARFRCQLIDEEAEAAPRPSFDTWIAKYKTTHSVEYTSEKTDYENSSISRTSNISNEKNDSASTLKKIQNENTNSTANECESLKTRPVFCCLNDDESIDSQLKLIIVWLAASMAKVPYLVVNPGDKQWVKHIPELFCKLETREWKLGNLACEALRYCRINAKQLPSKDRERTLFNQIIGTSSDNDS
ncbi:uncharacterized protein B4U79_00066 [Dinothrombium tinctorium]|uniref:Uncharacterized protein n=1 Tax=Dinothrombium tinctorium TaxID=1965070 RepID=A0A3S3NNX0_9ACAR|nr:uncharacterized protein B4U79_00066 [Dinothrombium tinctorium]